jgi:hypothetical protein
MEIWAKSQNFYRAVFNIATVCDVLFIFFEPARKFCLFKKDKMVIPFIHSSITGFDCRSSYWQY